MTLRCRFPLLALALFITLAHPGAAVTQSPSPVTRRTPQFENESVRVWRSSIAPQQPLNMHRHENGRVLVALTGGTVKIVKESGESRTVTWESGKAYWLSADPPGERHADINQGPESIEVMVVELKPPAPAR
jgi:quercetin dioxygenase-like cupin family protein